VQVLGIAPGERRDRIDAGELQQVGILLADALDPGQIRPVDPLEQQLAADAVIFSRSLRAFGVSPALSRASCDFTPASVSLAAYVAPMPSMSISFFGMFRFPLGGRCRPRAGPPS